MTQTIPDSDFPMFEAGMRERLRELRQIITAALASSGDSQYAAIASEVHGASEDSWAGLLVDVHLAEIAREVEQARDIDAALLRIETGDYGACIDCGQSIGRSRLQAWPTAKRCVSCQTGYERRRGGRPGPTPSRQ